MAARPDIRPDDQASEEPRPQGFLSPFLKWAKRHAALIGLALGVLGLALAYFQWRFPASPPPELPSADNQWTRHPIPGLGSLAIPPGWKVLDLDAKLLTAKVASKDAPGYARISKSLNPQTFVLMASSTVAPSELYVVHGFTPPKSERLSIAEYMTIWADKKASVADGLYKAGSVSRGAFIKLPIGNAYKITSTLEPGPRMMGWPLVQTAIGIKREDDYWIIVSMIPTFRMAQDSHVAEEVAKTLVIAGSGDH